MDTAGTLRTTVFDTVASVAKSFSTRGSAEHPDVAKVRAAVELVRAQEPELLVDGELQADAALDLAVARRKLPDPGPVAGRANVLIFPDLDAGNIGYKLVRAACGAQALGVFLQGFRHPAVDLSRGATPTEIYHTATVLAALCGPPRRAGGDPAGMRAEMTR